MAIAYDNSAYLGNSANSSGSYTTSGTDRLLLVFMQGDSASNPASMSATYNGVSMTSLTSQYGRSAFSQYGMAVFGLINPASGAHTLAWNGGGDSARCIAVSYTGVSQTGLPDATSKSTITSGTTKTQSITTVAQNCWVAYQAYCNAGNVSISSGATLRQQSPGRNNDDWIGDTNAAVSAGSNSASFAFSSVAWAGFQAVSFAPVAASGPANVKTWDGVTQSTGIKTYMGVALASTKSVMGVT